MLHSSVHCELARLVDVILIHINEHCPAGGKLNHLHDGDR